MLTNWTTAKNGCQVRSQDCVPPFAADYIIKMDSLNALAVHSAFKFNSWTYEGGNLTFTTTEACEEWQHHIDSSCNKIQSLMPDTNIDVNVTLVFVIPSEQHQMSNTSQSNEDSGYFTLSESNAKQYNLSLPANVNSYIFTIWR